LRLDAPQRKAFALLWAGGFFLTAAMGCRRAAERGPIRADPLNAVYAVEGRDIRLTGGRSEVEEAPGSTAKVVTSVFAPPVPGDLDGKNGEDAALILVQSPGGSGTFYYVAAFLDSGRHASGTNAVLLGDRIAPYEVTIERRRVLVIYADRMPGEPMTTPPHIRRSVRLAVREGRLAVVEASGTEGPHSGSRRSPTGIFPGF
jgi:hypothetical protein